MTKALSYRAIDLLTLARTLWGEARSESWRGLIAVAWVVRNRLAKPGWWSRQQGDGIPDDTIEAVCRDKWQFSCWWDSQKARVSTRTPAQLGLCYQAAQAVLDGIEDDPTGGADHYHTIAKPDYAKTWPPEWAKGHKGVVIGNHVFYRIGLRQ